MRWQKTEPGIAVASKQAPKCKWYDEKMNGVEGNLHRFPDYLLSLFWDNRDLIEMEFTDSWKLCVSEHLQGRQIFLQVYFNW